MPGQDQTEVTSESIKQPADEVQIVQPIIPESSPTPAVGGREFDWLALGVVLLIAAVFALAARLSPQPATSLTPAAVLSVTGCGLLVTAIRKLHTFQRPGLFEAALGGLFLALFQLMAAITYPNVFYILSQVSDERQGFLSTWALIIGFSVIFSLVGAALGHLAFAPLRPLPAKTKIDTAGEVMSKAVGADLAPALAPRRRRESSITTTSPAVSSQEVNHVYSYRESNLS